MPGPSTIGIGAVLTAAALAAGFAWGVAADRYGWFPSGEARALLNGLAPGHTALRLGFADTRGRNAFDCRTLGPDTLTLLLFGQSNAANSGDTPYPTSPRDVYNFNIVDDRCYAAADPLLGTTGTGGSIWTRLAARIVDQGIAPRVLLVPIAVSGSTVAEWAPPGELSGRAPHAINQLGAFGLPVHAALWQQGESDGATPSGHYVESFTRIAATLRAAGFGGRLIVADSTRCGGAPHERVRSANAMLTGELRIAEAGPDLDRLAGPEFRYDGCHLNERGQQVASAGWLEAIARGPLIPTASR